MPNVSRLGSTDEERVELETVIEAIGRSSRLAQLLLYIGERRLDGPGDQLSEYTIATEVFGRSKTTFDAGEDAIVRVEAHRLRKRLKEYYESVGKNHHIKICLPAGSYLPVVTRHPVAYETEASEAAPTGDEAALPRPRNPFWYYAAAATAAVLIVVVAYLVFRLQGVRRQSAIAAASAAPPASSLAGVAFAKVPLRILAGYDGKPQIDSAGALWQPDEYFQSGGTWARRGSTVLRTSDPFLFEHWRDRDFSYDLPLHPGVYEVHLYFVSMDLNPSSPETFSVSVNGKPLLTSFDINSDALQPNIADEQVFRDISPTPDGVLHLGFAGERSPSMLNAIEILPGLPHKLLPVRIVTQPASFTDDDGQIWHPDNYYLGGYASEKSLPVSGTLSPRLFAGERYGHFSYAIPVDPRDQYTLILHFAELYFGPNASGVGGTGSRVFRVRCNGNTLLDNFDIYKEAGSLHALTKTFYHLRPSTQGKLNLTFEPIANYATVSAIEVLDESQ